MNKAFKKTCFIHFNLDVKQSMLKLPMLTQTIAFPAGLPKFSLLLLPAHAMDLGEWDFIFLVYMWCVLISLICSGEFGGRRRCGFGKLNIALT